MIRPLELLALALGIVVAFASAALIDAGMQFLLCEVLVLFLMAQMWNLLAGFAGRVSLGQQLFVGAGAYLLCLIANNTQIPFWLVVAAIPLLVGIAAIPLGMVMFHLKHAYFAVGMWVAAEIAYQLVIKTPWLGRFGGMPLRPGGSPMQGFPEQIVLAIAIIASVGLIVALRVFLRTRIGLATLAVRDDADAAESAGVDVRRLHLLLFCVTAGGTAGAAALYYTTTLSVTPVDAFQINWVIAMLFIVVIGGIGTLTGPVIGVTLLIGMRELMTSAGYTGGQYWIVMGIIAIAVLLLTPRGIWPALHKLFLSFRRKVVS